MLHSQARLLRDALTGCRLSRDNDEHKVVRRRKETPPLLKKMNEPNSNPEDAKLGLLLRESRVSPTLPSHFSDRVWRRIERGEVSQTSEITGWLDALAAWMLRPKFALAGAAALILAGVALGLQQGTQAARQDAQTRYVSAVAPDAVR